MKSSSKAKANKHVEDHLSVLDIPYLLRRPTIRIKYVVDVVLDVAANFIHVLNNTRSNETCVPGKPAFTVVTNLHVKQSMFKNSDVVTC